MRPPVRGFRTARRGSDNGEASVTANERMFGEAAGILLIYLSDDREILPEEDK
jgi:hypothetical protein